MALRGESHPQHKLTEEQVYTIRKLWKVGHRNVRVLARNNGVSPANIRRIVKMSPRFILNNSTNISR